MGDKLDRLFAAYCSPTLAGIKAGSLVACDRALYPDLPRRIRDYQKAFATRGFHFEIVCACRERWLLLVYQRERLAMSLTEDRAARLLRHFGYPAGQDVDALLYHLKRRMAANESFPHEIGLFLGYPYEDVEGFIRNSGKGYKLSRYWKVYGDAEETSRLFDRLARVCRTVVSRVEQGESLLHVFAAA